MSEPGPRKNWKSLSERDQDENFVTAGADEFAEPIPEPHAFLSRRDFLLAAGFTLAGLGGCQKNPLARAPVETILPPLQQTEEMIPGRALYYATSCGGCSAGCGVLARTRDGRPIKLEGNPEHPLSRGGLCAVGQASLLGLYDQHRFQYPLRDGQPSSWQEIDRSICTRLEEIRRQGGTVRILSGTITSPTTLGLIQDFLRPFRNGRHVQYDALSCSAILDAHERTHGVGVLPHYRLDRAAVIVSFDADFLGTWIAPVEFAAAYRTGRDLESTPRRYSYHVQVESRLSLTGSKADERVRLAPGELGLVMTHLARRLASRAAIPVDWQNLEGSPVPHEKMDLLAEKLWQARQRSLVLCGSQDLACQILCNFLNHLLGNYGFTLEVDRPSYQRQGNDHRLAELRDELKGRKVDALFILDCNPVYELPDGASWVGLLRRVPLLVCCAERADETAQVAAEKPAEGTPLARFSCPFPHFLASWTDAEPVSGLISLSQPTVPRLGDTRPILESLAAWMGRPGSAHNLIQEHWQRHIFPRRQDQNISFQSFWDQAVHDGLARVEPRRETIQPFALGAVTPVSRAQRPGEETFDLVLYPKVAMLEGKHAYNPWLQELPDPISKVTWDNYACVSPRTASRLGLAESDVIRLELAGEGPAQARSLELPVLIQPGQHDQVVPVALGYGSQASARFAGIGQEWLEARPTLGENGLVGVNTAPLLGWENGRLLYHRSNTRINKTNRRHPLALTQTHHTITVPLPLVPSGQVRPLVQKITLEEVEREARSAGRAAQNDAPRSATHAPHSSLHASLWPDDHPVTGPHWGMVIDLNACTGCGACVIACQAENNIPVVGKDEVHRQREMHWIRIDRYYSGEEDDLHVYFQPMLCQHCGNAPCETVCPVLATLHSSEGLNQQIYNRCVGTRYCANNCPYKVRRFNWFDYAHDDNLHNLVLNPDVTVRSRGVMEKCSFCVQRIQEARIEARRRGIPIGDDMLQTACQQSCPAKAIVFGNLNDSDSRVTKLMKNPRQYQVLAELNVQPVVSYLKVVRQQEEGGDHRG